VQSAEIKGMVDEMTDEMTDKMTDERVKESSPGECSFTGAIAGMAIIKTSHGNRPPIVGQRGAARGTGTNPRISPAGALSN
jgi:pyruvate/2-oxoglutarate/acetoin dehydrogenase E1 component